MVIAIYGRSHRCEGHGEYGSPCVAHPPPLNPAPISPPLSRRASWQPIMPPNRSEYQPLAQNADDEEADDWDEMERKAKKRDRESGLEDEDSKKSNKKQRKR